jgi:hypothetical protein
MPPLTLYTESELSSYILDITVLGSVAKVLSWTTQADIQQIINDSIRAYGVATIDLATDVRRLELLTKREAIVAALRNLATFYSIAVGGDSFQRNQMRASLEADLKTVTAEIDAKASGKAISYTIVQGTPFAAPLTTIDDPRSSDIPNGP